MYALTIDNPEIAKLAKEVFSKEPISTNRASLRDLAYYLKKNGLDSKFIENYMNDIRAGIKKVLTVFPETGTEQNIDGYTCRRIMLQEHSVLYRYNSEQR